MDKALQVDNNGLVNGCRTDKVTMLLDLPDDPDHLWRAIGSKRRSQIKRPIREGVSFRLGHSELLNDFYKVFSLNMRDLGTPVYGKEFFEAILAAFTDETQVAVVYLEGTPVGGAFLLNHNGTMEIPWASTDRRFNRYGINMFMYWNILESAIKQGIQTFDFGRSSIESGTLKFKKQWGAKPKQLFWYYQLDSEKPIPQLNHSNKKLRLFIQAWKKLPLFIANRLGPFIVKDLP
jgi:FemAB-related protein (PEP-CTERM system-associated)